MEKRTSHDADSSRNAHADNRKPPADAGKPTPEATAPAASVESRRPWAARRASGPRWTDVVAQF